MIYNEKQKNEINGDFCSRCIKCDIYGMIMKNYSEDVVTAHAEETLSVPAEEAGAGAVQMDGKDAQAAEDGSVAASIAWKA